MSSTAAGEQRQADEVVRHYRTLISHPSVRSITYWGLTDDGAWLGAPAGLVGTDGTPEPAYDVLRALVKGEWWLPPATERTDGAGRLEVRGFLGDYRVDHAGRTAPLTIAAPGQTATTLRLHDHGDAR